MLSHPFRILAISALLAGCSALGGGEPVRAFEPQAPQTVRAAKRSERHMVIEEPTTSGALNTEQILIRPNRIEASYLPAAEWSDEVPLMVQTLLMRSVQASGGFAYVGRAPLGRSADYAVLTELTDFQAEITPSEAGDVVRARIGLVVQLIREDDAKVLATRTFTRETPATGTDPLAVAAALDTGLRDVLPDVTRWLLGATGLGASG